MFRMRSPEIYPYAPLDLSRQTFRLIRLLPPKPPVIPGRYGTLRIEIIEAEIDAASKPSRAYDALTYVWGVAAHERPTRAIIVEDRGASYRLWIHRPLELALLHLVQDRVTHLPLFVDQICINQDANGGGHNEKAHQVRLMRAIYSRCRRALVWLGTATRASDEWFTYTREICHSGLLSGLMGPRAPSFMRVFDAVMDPSVSVAGQAREDRDALLALVLRHGGDRYPVAGFADVLDRPWFGRLWTIQEACLAPGVTVVCGRQALCLECFRAGALFFSVCNTHWVRQPGAQTGAELRRRDAIFQKTPRLQRVVQERKAIHATGVRQSFYDVVLKYNVNGGRAKIGATLPEDRIFGLLGLAADDDPLRRRVRVRYDAVDPEAGVVRIYTEVAALLLGHSVDALLRAGRRGGLPSWVPDWTMELRLPVGYASLKEALFCAGGPGDQGRFCVDLEAGRLTIRGCMVGEVVAVGGRTYRDRVDGMMQRDVDYRWAKKFFDEAAQFTRDAGAMRDDDEASLAMRSAAGLRLGLEP
ncbi:Heterokaryon incompatibility protein 6, OR allele [Metarhizium anisopliae]